MALLHQMIHNIGKYTGGRLTGWSYLAATSVNKIHSTQSNYFLDARDKDKEERNKQLVVRQEVVFDEFAQKHGENKLAFNRAVVAYLRHESSHRRGHVEFIYAALSKMKQFGVHRDLSSYKRLLGIFPKGKMVPKSKWQVEFQHYPKQQQCCIDLLEQMEYNAVVPDDDMGYRLKAAFGTDVHAFRKYQRMMYWMPKFKNANPYALPLELPDDAIELAKLALKKMAVDLENKVTVHETKMLESAWDDTFVASAQSRIQRALIGEHSEEEPVFVEGGFPIWLREKKLTYFVLKAGVTHRVKINQDLQEESAREESTNPGIFDIPYWSGGQEDPAQVVVAPSVHEQDDGTILGMCITGTGSKDSLISWIKFLQGTNPKLQQIPVLFSLVTPEGGVTEYREEQQEQSVAPS